jgi:DNA-binding transcriptional ArsR family regulator
VADSEPDRVLRPTPRQLKVLAHPLRARILGALRFEGSLNATVLAQKLETNSGATSYHLRQLEDAGLVEEDTDRRSGRERWWRAAHDSTSWSSVDYEDDDDARAADDWLLRHHAQRAGEWLHTWLDEREKASASWRAVAALSDYHLDLDPEALGKLVEELDAVVQRYRTGAPASGEQIERVTLLLQAFPSPGRTP